MSILIKDIEMPKERGSFTVTIKYNGLVFDTETGIQVAEAQEVSPHGRLIDVDVLRQDWLENGENEYAYDTNASLDSLDHAPTIIEAELPVHHGIFAATSEQETLKRIILPEGEE